MRHILYKYIFISIILILCLHCSNNEKKIYKQFDLIDFTESDPSNKEFPLLFSSMKTSPFEGGEGFETIAEVYGWETNNDVISNGDPIAIKGDTITIIGGGVFPPTLRGFGKESRSQLLALIENTSYESLLIFNPETFKWEPELATHWRVGKDSLTFFFRIDPRAKWSDGRDVTAQDVVATYKILTDKGHGDPSTYTQWRELFEEPIAETKYIVSIKSHNDNQ